MKVFRLSIIIVLFISFLQIGVQASPIPPVTVEEFQESEAGTYPVIIEYIDEKTGEKLEKIVMMTLYYPNTITNVELGEGIDAMDVVLDEGSVAKFSPSELVEKAKVKAWNLRDGTSVQIIKTSINKVSASEQNNLYNISFKTAKGTEITVSFLEIKTEQILMQDEVYMDDFTSLDSQISDWIYIIMLSFILIPIIIICFSLIRMLILVKKTKNLLYQEYEGNH